MLYGESRGLGCWVGTPEGHSPHGSGDHVHISDFHGLALHHAATAH